MRTWIWIASLLIAGAVLAACSDDPETPTDGGADADADVDFKITPPAPPVLTPRPDGWVEVPPEEEGGVTTCDPWPGSSPVVMTPCSEGGARRRKTAASTANPGRRGVLTNVLPRDVRRWLPHR